MDDGWLRDKAAQWGQGSEVRHDVTLADPGDPIGITYGKHPYREGRIVVVAVTEGSSADKALPTPIPVGGVIVSIDSIEVDGEESLRFAVSQIRSERKTRFPIMCEQKIVRDAAAPTASAFESRLADDESEVSRDVPPVLITTPAGDEVKYVAGRAAVKGRTVPAICAYQGGDLQSTATRLSWHPLTGTLRDQDGVGAEIPVEKRAQFLPALAELADSIGVMHNLPSAAELAAWEDSLESEVTGRVKVALQEEQDRRGTAEREQVQEAIEAGLSAVRKQEEDAARMARELQAATAELARWQDVAAEEEARQLEAERMRLDARQRAHRDMLGLEHAAMRLREKAVSLDLQEQRLRQRADAAQAATDALRGAMELAAGEAAPALEQQAHPASPPAAAVALPPMAAALSVASPPRDVKTPPKPPTPPPAPTPPPPPPPAVPPPEPTARVERPSLPPPVRLWLPPSPGSVFASR
eukprot:TRINITY_DN16919_c0_g1_i2.p1 TRINITY_DN16919_c0_g1~~TRINITY_DN16919_c0_g1_i2.p1  ORF type:complete len:470 (+),score=142.17 TRINITY_DN16919_c0_g1_i2:641-2050(+)